MTSRTTTDVYTAFIYNLLGSATIHAVERAVKKLELDGALFEINGIAGETALHLAERLSRLQAAQGSTSTPPPAPETPVVYVATENGAGYTTLEGDPSHDTPEARARGFLARRCERAGLPLHQVIALREELNKYVQNFASARPFPTSTEYKAEFEAMNTSLLYQTIEAFLLLPTGQGAEILRARAVPLLARLGKDTLLDWSRPKEPEEAWDNG